MGLFVYSRKRGGMARLTSSTVPYQPAPGRPYHDLSTWEGGAAAVGGGHFGLGELENV